MYSNTMPKRRFMQFLFCALCALVLFAGCEEALTPQEPVSELQKMGYTYKYAQIERALAATTTPYIVLNTKNNRLEVLQSGAIVWDEPFSLNEKEAKHLDHALLGNMLNATEPAVRYVKERKLLQHHKRYADSVLTIISGILNVEPAMLQRELPVKFELKTSDGLLFRFEADDDTLLAEQKKPLRSVLDGLFGFGKGDPVATFRMPMERALTLYYVAHPGAMVLIDPPLSH